MNIAEHYEYPSIFGYDEELILNQIGMYRSLEDCIGTVKIQIEAALDDDVRNLLEMLHYKLNRLSQSEWEEIQKHMPFSTPYGFYDEEEEHTEHEPWTDEDMEKFKKIIEHMEQESEQQG